jgi:hypothetical protein
VVEKLKEVQPLSLGQASRISGMTPAAISVLQVHLEKTRIYLNPAMLTYPDIDPVLIAFGPSQGPLVRTYVRSRLRGDLFPRSLGSSPAVQLAGNGRSGSTTSTFI